MLLDPLAAAAASVQRQDWILEIAPVVEIGSHTCEHTVLEHADAEAAHAEVSASRSDLEEMLDVSVGEAWKSRQVRSVRMPR
ncbi:MAG: hypothetical protein QOD41_2413 [Cryptosporangiaceae bacterium]|jgi:hypothetical protein|nr:hypothetical protein [Cryptosporangiaceae bacterium]